MQANSTFLISRTDSIGDVILTIPMAGLIKSAFPGAKVFFLGKKYTHPIIEACTYIDRFIDIDSFLREPLPEKIDCILHVLPKKAIAQRAKQLRIPIRIGTTNRIYHWWTCNKLIKLSRKKSDLHEAQLNTLLLQPFVQNLPPSLAAIGSLYGMDLLQPLQNNFLHLLSPKKTNLILHPKSQGSAREWPLENYITLIQSLPEERYNIFISGTAQERLLLDPLFDAAGYRVHDICGQMPLSQFIAFIGASDALVACSTGPLHIAAAIGIHAIGIYIPIRPVHPGRWTPIGKHVKVFVAEEEGRQNIQSDADYYMAKITPIMVARYLDQIKK